MGVEVFSGAGICPFAGISRPFFFALGCFLAAWGVFVFFPLCGFFWEADALDF